MSDDDSDGARDRDTELADLFDDADLEEIDEDAVWAELDDGDDAAAGDGDLFERLADENPSQEPSPDIDAERDTAVVPKNRFCQRCEYFSAPPEVRCNNPGTTIEEVVDSEQFRVRSCPVVADRHGTSDILDVE